VGLGNWELDIGFNTATWVFAGKEKGAKEKKKRLLEKNSKKHIYASMEL